MTDALDTLAHTEIVERGVAPSAVVGVAVLRDGELHVALGAAGRTADRPTDTESVFDLASITKSFVGVAAARLVERGVVRFETAVSELVEESRGTPSASVTLEQLLGHRSGLEAHLSLFAPLTARATVSRPEMLARALLARRADCAGTPPESGFSPVYSDLGYLIAGELLTRVASMPLDELVMNEVSRPLGLSARSARQWLGAGEDFAARVAPTEYVDFRGGLVRGVVHDENAWAYSGHGLSGHAGLFGTARDVLGLGMAVLAGLSGHGSGWLSRETLAHLVRERPGGSLRLGFDGKSGPNASAGPSASALTFGHLGFTGTSLWCDPVAGCATVLLTNRVCPSRRNGAIREARPRVHEALFAFGRGARFADDGTRGAGRNPK